MPLTSEGAEVLAKMRKTYGSEKGESVFYATANKRKASGRKWHATKGIKGQSSRSRGLGRVKKG